MVNVGDKTIVLPLQGGGKVAIPIVTPGIGDPCIVIPLQGGGKAVTKLWTPSSGEKVIVMPLQGGGKVVVPLTQEVISDLVILHAATIIPDGESTLRVRAHLEKVSAGVGRAEVELGVNAYTATPLRSIDVISQQDIPEGGITIETGDISIPYRNTSWASIDVQKGAYVRITSVEQSLDGGVTWTYVTDGDFSEGEFKDDMQYGWLKTEFGFSAQMVTGGCETIDVP
ncbi:MAG: hypothetical protein PHS80_00260 [Methanothrix sp.]|nr:hypothetical protein [Bacteroidales bacterium]MDD2753933.1 hypothetical protein [Methanothrix sp.]